MKKQEPEKQKPEKQERERSTIALVSLRTVAEQIDFSAETIDGWVRLGLFPKPIVARPGSPRRFRLRDVEAWIEARRRARHTKPAPRGRLKQNQPIKRWRPGGGR